MRNYLDTIMSLCSLCGLLGAMLSLGCGIQGDAHLDLVGTQQDDFVQSSGSKPERGFFAWRTQSDFPDGGGCEDMAPRSHNLVVKNNLLVAVDEACRLTLVDIREPNKPSFFSNATTDVSALALSEDGRIAYVATQQNTLELWSVANPQRSTQISALSFSHWGYRTKMVVLDGLLIGVMYGQLFLVDVSDPFMPEELATINIGHAGPSDVAINNGYAYIPVHIDQGVPLQIVDIRDPANPFPLNGEWMLSLSMDGAIDIVDNKAFVVSQELTGGAHWQHEQVFKVYDLSEPEAPELMTRFSPKLNYGGKLDIAVDGAGDYAYVTSAGAHSSIANMPGFFIFDLRKRKPKLAYVDKATTRCFDVTMQKGTNLVAATCATQQDDSTRLFLGAMMP